MARKGKIYPGKPLEIKNRKALLATIRPQLWKHLPADAKDVPEPRPSPKLDRTQIRTGAQPTV